MTTGPHQSDEARPRRRPWDNTGLRHGMEGRPIEGVDGLALQSSIVARAPEPARRWLRPSR
ncbi:MAG TPA: hypothetical protein VFI59_06210 [Actinomycetota bacterium]|nr:hypothetical protein [Actinomycetota bacterium]